MRMAGLLCVAGLFAGAASAQEQSPSAVSACPRGPLSIYFASGDSTASPQAQALIGKIGETATSCQPDRIDLIARIDTATDGDSAVAVALARLNTVVANLVSHGLSADHIRVAALSSVNPQEPMLNQIDVVFAKDDAAADDTSPAAPNVRAVLDGSI